MPYRAGGGIESVVEDATPQLGGDLDLNGHRIADQAGSPDARGPGAQDLQLDRLNGADVASGDQAVIGGGKYNEASGSQATVPGGYSNLATGFRSFAACRGARASGQYAVAMGNNPVASGGSAVAMGYEAKASGDSAVAMGYGAEATALASFAEGRASKARLRGAHAHAAGSWDEAGDCQLGRYVLSGRTTDADWTELFLDGASARLTIPEGYVFGVTVKITGAREDAAEVARYTFEGIVENLGGTVAVNGFIETAVHEDDAGWDAKVEADDVNDSLKVSVQGAAGAEIRWVARVETEEIGGFGGGGSS